MKLEKSYTHISRETLSSILKASVAKQKLSLESIAVSCRITKQGVVNSLSIYCAASNKALINVSKAIGFDLTCIEDSTGKYFNLKPIKNVQA